LGFGFRLGFGFGGGAGIAVVAVRGAAATVLVAVEAVVAELAQPINAMDAIAAAPSRIALDVTSPRPAPAGSH
jgi:hypothetical protein